MGKGHLLRDFVGNSQSEAFPLGFQRGAKLHVETPLDLASPFKCNHNPYSIHSNYPYLSGAGTILWSLLYVNHYSYFAYLPIWDP